MMFPSHRLLPLIALWAISVMPLFAATNDPKLMDKAWDDVSMLQVQEGHLKFEEAEANPTYSKREATYGEAVTLLNVQPKTTGNINRAEMLFSHLIAENPRDEIGISSLYYLARIEQIHRNDPNPLKALQLYTQLIREQPEHPLAQIALTKIAILKLCTINGDKTRALAEVEKLATQLKSSAARCNFDIVVGEACQRYQLGDDKALHYYLDADAAGIPVQYVEANILLRIANLFLKQGKRDLAIPYFERFLKEFPRSTRCFTVREQLNQLKAGSR